MLHGHVGHLHAVKHSLDQGASSVATVGALKAQVEAFESPYRDGAHPSAARLIPLSCRAPSAKDAASRAESPSCRVSVRTAQHVTRGTTPVSPVQAFVGTMFLFSLFYQNNIMKYLQYRSQTNLGLQPSPPVDESGTGRRDEFMMEARA